MIPRILCMTSDPYLPAVKPFMWLLNKYWRPNPEVIVAGFTKPDFDLPINAKFLSLGKFSEFPLGKWSDALAVALQMIEDEHIIIMLEDYWIVRPVDIYAVSALYEYAKRAPDVIKVDLCADRLFSAGVKRHQYHIGYIELLVSDPMSPYHMSLMTGIWKVEHLMGIIQPDWSPWDIETIGTEVLQRKPHLHVIGTAQWPVMHTLAFRNADIKKINLNELRKRDVEEMTRLGLLDPWLNEK